MTLVDEFESLSPYSDSQVALALKELRESDDMVAMLRAVVPGVNLDAILDMTRGINSVTDFQGKVMSKAVAHAVTTTMDGFTVDGLEKLDHSRHHLFISNHRDIVLDSALLGWSTFRTIGQTMQVAIGDNLITKRWLEHLFKLNKTVIVARSLPKRALFEASKRLSAYIYHVVAGGRDSFWIAQAEGRSKTGDDFTQSGLVKMIALAGGKDWAGHVLSLDPVPVSVSYEYDPCDVAKAREQFLRRQGGEYKKSAHEDLASMARGVLGYKGRVHLQVGPSLGAHWHLVEAGQTRGERLTILTDLLDRCIIGNYRLWPTNYIAHDLHEGTATYQEHYSQAEKARFEQRLSLELDGDPHRLDIYPLVLRMYANPVYNRENIQPL